jgi:hypothetical protein
MRGVDLPGVLAIGTEPDAALALDLDAIHSDTITHTRSVADRTMVRARRGLGG